MLRRCRPWPHRLRSEHTPLPPAPSISLTPFVLQPRRSSPTAAASASGVTVGPALVGQWLDVHTAVDGARRGYVVVSPHPSYSLPPLISCNEPWVGRRGTSLGGNACASVGRTVRRRGSARRSCNMRAKPRTRTATRHSRRLRGRSRRDEPPRRPMARAERGTQLAPLRLRRLGQLGAGRMSLAGWQV